MNPVERGDGQAGVDHPHPGAAPTPLLQVDDLCFAYPQRRVFAHWSAHFAAGVTALCGGEGSGKTTLLKLLCGDLGADGGRLSIAGVRLDQQPGDYRSQVFRTDPRSQALDQVTPQDWFASLRERYPRFDPVRCNVLLQRLSLQEHRHKPMFMLSTGSRRKVWLAAAGACSATVTLLDQPFDALDQASVAAVLALLHDASRDRARAWLVADYEPPPGLALAQSIDLG